MNAAFLRGWQTLRLSLHVSPASRAVYSTYRPFFEVSKQSFDNPVPFLGVSCCLHAGLSQSSRQIIPFGISRLTRQARCATFWKRPAKEKTPDEVPATIELRISPADVVRVFGKRVDPEKGVEILTALQEHRSQGTLDHKLPYSENLITKGLAYLRNADPIDEDAAIIARIDREANRLPQTNVERSPQAVSQFEQLREENKKRHELEEAEREKEKAEDVKKQGHVKPGKLETRSEKTTAASNDLAGLRQEPAWIRKYREEATNQDIKKTHISTWARLLPSAIVTVTVVGLSIIFAYNYTPPSRSARLWPETPPAAATVITLIGINLVVFISWRIPPLWKFMNKNFLIVPVFPYSMSMIGASFSHQSFSHLVANIIILWLVGTRGEYLTVQTKAMF